MPIYKVIVKHHGTFTDWISKINNTLVNNVADINVVLSMYNLIEYWVFIYLSKTGSLWQYYNEESPLNNDYTWKKR